MTINLDILEDNYESYSGEDIVDWFISRINVIINYLNVYLNLIFHLIKILLLHLLLSISIVERTWVMIREVASQIFLETMII